MSLRWGIGFQPMMFWAQCCVLNSSRSTKFQTQAPGNNQDPIFKATPPEFRVVAWILKFLWGFGDWVLDVQFVHRKPGIGDRPPRAMRRGTRRSLRGRSRRLQDTENLPRYSERPRGGERHDPANPSE